MKSVTDSTAIVYEVKLAGFNSGDQLLRRKFGTDHGRGKCLIGRRYGRGAGELAVRRLTLI